MKKIFIYYNFIIVTIMTVTGFLNAENPYQTISSLFFYPLFVYFALQVLPSTKHSVKLPKAKKAKAVVVKDSEKPAVLTPEPEEEEVKAGRLDDNRRVFLKLIASAGVSLFILSMFTKKAQGAFFGSVPGPGTVSLKDSSGNQIDPALNHPTDGYKLAQVDDSVPTYYGYLDKSGNWYILREDSSGNYRYAKGASNFSTNWTGRAGLSYDYYDAIF